MNTTFKQLLFLFLLPHIAWSQKQEPIDFKSRFDLAVAEYQKFESDHGHYIQTPNVNMHYSTWGNPKDSPLVWVHGSYQNSTEILEIVDRLVAAHIYVIAIDYYGHGLTNIPDKFFRATREFYNEKDGCTDRRYELRKSDWSCSTT